MVCHEVWSYNDDAMIATLTALTIVCPLCNLAEQPGRASLAGYSDGAQQQLATVNGVSLEEAAALIDECMEVWRRRSQHSWTVAVAPDLLQRFPELNWVALH